MAQQVVDKIFLKKIALRISELRRINSIGQDVFYMDTNIHVARLEMGVVNIRVNTIAEICKYFDISVSEFFEGIELPSHPNACRSNTDSIAKSV